MNGSISGWCVHWADPLGLSLVDGLWGFAKGAAFAVATVAVISTLPVTAPVGAALAAAGAISLATAYYEGKAAYYDPNVSGDQMHEFIGEVAGSIVGCVAGFKMVRAPRLRFPRRAGLADGALKNLSSSQLKSIRSFEGRIAEHRAKLDDFRANPTVRPVMEGLPDGVIKAQ